MSWSEVQDERAARATSSAKLPALLATSPLPRSVLRLARRPLQADLRPLGLGRPGGRMECTISGVEGQQVPPPWSAKSMAPIRCGTRLRATAVSTSACMADIRPWRQMGLVSHLCTGQPCCMQVWRTGAHEKAQPLARSDLSLVLAAGAQLSRSCTQRFKALPGRWVQQMQSGRKQGHACTTAVDPPPLSPALNPDPSTHASHLPRACLLRPTNRHPRAPPPNRTP